VLAWDVFQRSAVALSALGDGIVTSLKHLLPPFSPFPFSLGKGENYFTIKKLKI
jgi:hypothetical protein